jgi:hypothetical protein
MEPASESELGEEVLVWSVCQTPGQLVPVLLHSSVLGGVADLYRNYTERSLGIIRYQ